MFSAHAARIALLAVLTAAALPAQAQAQAQDGTGPHWKEMRDEIRARQVEERRNFSSMTREEREALREKHRAEDRAWQRERDEYLNVRGPDDGSRGRSEDYRDDDRYRRDDDDSYRRHDDDHRRRDDDYRDREHSFDDDAHHGRKNKQKQKGKHRD